MENILSDKSLIFHGVGNNIFSFIGILKYGICSNSKSRELANPFFCVNTVGSNGYNYICTSLSPSINGIENSDTYNKYIKNGIGFIIKTDENMELTNNTGVMTSYNDICYVKSYIPTDSIVGIIVNKDILNKRLSEVSFGMNKKYLTYSTVVPKKCYHILECMRIECGYSCDDDTLRYFIEKRDYDSIDNLISLYVDNAFKYKFSGKSVTLGDIISFYNQDRFKIYDETGICINPQNVTKK